MREIMERKWNWAGHLERMQDDQWKQRIKKWWLRDDRKKGRQKRRWRDGIVEFIKNKNSEEIDRQT